MIYISAKGTGGSASAEVQQPLEILGVSIDSMLESANLFSLYPNPFANNVINLDLNIHCYENLDFMIYNELGMMISCQKINCTQTTISTETFTNSIYFLSVRTNGRTIKTFKILKK